jgi:subtilisin family serine protease
MARVRTPYGLPVRAAAVASLAALAACSTDLTPTAPGSAPSRAASEQPGGGPQFVAGELLVRFRPGASAEARGRALGRANAQAAERIVTNAMRRAGDDEGVTVVRTAADVAAAAEALRASGDVEFAEPNWVYRTDATANDPYFTNGSLWGMYGAGTSPANQYGSGAAAAWAATQGGNCGNVWVGIIDEGYMFSHEDLAANAATNPGEGATADGRDNDGNGYVDDIRGWDFAGGNNTVFDGTGDDHGTHVAGTIGAVGGNGRGVAGVCWSVKLMNAKFLGSTGGTTANAVRAVDYFTDLKTRHGINLVATNNSWGGGGFSQALQDAIERANRAGILFVAAAGNNSVNCETGSCFPAEYPNANIIAVASITSTGAMSSFSNYGSTTIDIGAPGSGVWSTVPSGSRNRVTSGYASYNGTSMATPHVTGAAALYAARHAGASAATIKNAILSSATPTGSLGGRTATGGRLNVSGF